MRTYIKNFFTFRKMITPTIIKFLFWLLCIISMCLAIGAFLRQDIMTGFVIMIACPLLSRIFCELIIIFFRINENLTKINDSNI